MPETPTKAGWFWWRGGKGAAWQPLELSMRDGVLVVWFECVPYADLAGFGGEWGPSIPDPATLKALRELAAK